MNFGDTSDILSIIQFGVYLLRRITIFHISLYDLFYTLFAMGFALILVKRLYSRLAHITNVMSGSLVDNIAPLSPDEIQRNQINEFAGYDVDSELYLENKNRQFRKYME